MRHAAAPTRPERSWGTGPRPLPSAHPLPAATSLLAVVVLVLGGCGEDAEGTGLSDLPRFRVTVENVTPVFDFPAGGTLSRLFPGVSRSLELGAPPGSRLSFAMMFEPSNDLFLAPGEAGIPLFDDEGAPVSGDVTDQVMLWDAGTEANQEPGAGRDQPARQDAPGDGAEDPDPEIRPAEDEFGDLPSAGEILSVQIEHLGGHLFRVTFRNETEGRFLNGEPMTLGTGAWMIHRDAGPLFRTGQPVSSDAFEALVEDADGSILGERIAERSGLTSALSPGVWAVHTLSGPLFEPGEPDPGLGLEALAEDGDPGPLAAALPGVEGVVDAGTFTVPEGAGEAGPLAPGDAYTFTVEAPPDGHLSLATMLVETNDVFLATLPAGIRLFTAEFPERGDVTESFRIWEAGTEVDEPPGAGPNQAPRQPEPGAGSAEGGVVGPATADYAFRDPEVFIRVTLTPIG